MLERSWSGPDSALIPIYGRRRVGKSALIRHFLREKPHIYQVGKQGSPTLQIAEFLQAAAEALAEPLLARLAPMGWRDALQAVVGRHRGKDKLVLAFDEFQWMVAASPELPGVLQELWDRDWSQSGRVMVLLSGSFIGFMERELLGAQSPLYGRRTAQLHLQPFDFREARAFHPSLPLADAARIYFVCGGIPAYLRRFDPERSLEQNLRDQLLDDMAPLNREPDFLLREELRELPLYYASLMALAQGAATLPEIAKVSGVPERSLPYYLNQLVELRYVRRRYPLDGQAPVARKVRYTLDDPMLRFWFRFVYPNQSMLGHLGPSVTYARQILPQLPATFGHCFEALCREALPMLYAEEGVEAPFEVGEFWAKDVQIDLVGLRQDGVTDLGECRWGERPSAQAVARELAQRAARYHNPRGARLLLWLFCQQAPADAPPKDLRVVSLERLYGLSGTPAV